MASSGEGSLTLLPSPCYFPLLLSLSALFLEWFQILEVLDSLRSPIILYVNGAGIFYVVLGTIICHLSSIELKVTYVVLLMPSQQS